ncbi:3-oxoacyl-[acyl-carrier-protein] reductase FabG-like isoform X1 [Helicoverpa zea]|uniref:3-oxoacyl-[acyl-carrier-protein] reductase FabG-like isoform X1 n=2 Tax=Helicoverpa zea TaxID=7113 RepID=UPI001F59E557|nr:3-oxoacyl-[acyl-carrier-protein] reductase FabG-like isoform X1 [Helicoverpa zea]
MSTAITLTADIQNLLLLRGLNTPRSDTRMFANKVVLVTGASSGIGAETAIQFAKLEAKLVLTGRNKDNLAQTAKQCEEASPKKLTPLSVVADIDNEADVERLMNETISNFKQLDVLVNNAGIMQMGSIEDTSLVQYDSIMNTNVRGPYYLTMLATPHLIKTKGNIVNVSSVAGLRSFTNVLAYCMSKAALDQFTRCVALELAGKGVRVNAVNPGVIETGIHLRGGVSEEDYAAYLEKCKETHALGRTGTTKEVANTIIFLASEGASNITGATIAVDGGRHAMCPR